MPWGPNIGCLPGWANGARDGKPPPDRWRIQAAVTLALVVGFGLSGSGFESLVIFTTPVF